MRYTTVRNPKWANAEHTMIDCEVDFDDLREEFVPFTAMQSGDTAHGHEIFAKCVAGEFGVVAEYAPVVVTDEEKAVEIRDLRNILLRESDWTQAADVPQATKDKWMAYRQALRDITAQAGFPWDVTFPQKP